MSKCANGGCPQTDTQLVTVVAVGQRFLCASCTARLAEIGVVERRECPYCGFPGPHPVDECVARAALVEAAA